MKHMLTCRRCRSELMQVQSSHLMSMIGLWAYVFRCPECGGEERAVLSPQERMELNIHIGYLEEQLERMISQRTFSSL